MSLPSPQVAFLRRLIAQRYPDRRKTGIAEALAAEHGIGRAQGARVLYGPADYQVAANVLLTRGYGVEIPERGFSRSEAGSGGSEKTGAHAVSENLLALMPVNMPFKLPAATRMLAMTVRDAMTIEHEAVLLVENLDTFLRLDEYRWLDSFIRGRAALAVFRGAPGYFRTDAPAQLLRALETPVLGFFDFDPSGLSMALDTPRLEALCVPSWEVLEPAMTSSRRDHLFYDQYHRHRAQLDAATHPAIAQAWSRIKVKGMGLNQEHFPR